MIKISKRLEVIAKYINDGLTTFKISIVGLSEFIYLIITSLLLIKKFYDANNLFGALVFDLAIFTPLIVPLMLL